jgi:hypothetical protein
MKWNYNNNQNEEDFTCNNKHDIYCCLYYNPPNKSLSYTNYK